MRVRFRDERGVSFKRVMRDSRSGSRGEFGPFIYPARGESGQRYRHGQGVTRFSENN